MWKEYLLVLGCVVIGYTYLTAIARYIKEKKAAAQQTSPSPTISNTPFLPTRFRNLGIRFFIFFFITSLVFFLLALGIQKVGLSTFILSFKYDLLPFLIFGLGILLALLFLTEEDSQILAMYKKLFMWCIR
jgi:hypothetical protein